jgi:hypothetical protein
MKKKLVNGIDLKVLMNHERPLFIMPDDVLVPMMWTSVRMMEDPTVPTAFKHHAMEMYQDAERELAIRN